MEDVVTSRANYARLDDPESAVRIRLSSTAVRAKHVGNPQDANQVEGRIVGIEILDASKRTDDPDVLKQFNFDLPTAG